MSRNIIEEMNQVSLAAIYLLPLLDMNMVTFGSNNFVDCFVTPDGNFILVQVQDLEEIEDPYHNKHYVTNTELATGEKFIIFSLTAKWRHTFEKFREGKYSEFTERAKTTIIKNTDLLWKVPGQNEKVITDARLMVLYKSGELKGLIEDQLDISLGDSELLNPPRDSVFRINPELDTILRHNAYPSL
jgi:hypothetical protein